MTVDGVKGLESLLQTGWRESADIELAERHQLFFRSLHGQQFTVADVAANGLRVHVPSRLRPRPYMRRSDLYGHQG